MHVHGPRKQYRRQHRENPDVHNPGVWMRRRVDWHCSVWPLRTPRRRTHRRGRRHLRTARPRTNPSPTSPRKLADVDWDSSKINPNKIRAESWPGAAFGPYRLLTERLRYETTPLLPSLRDRVHVHGQCDVTYASHRRSHAASGNSRATGASRRHEQHILTRLLPT